MKLWRKLSLTYKLWIGFLIMLAYCMWAGVYVSGVHLSAGGV